MTIAHRVGLISQRITMLTTTPQTYQTDFFRWDGRATSRRQEDPSEADTDDTIFGTYGLLRSAKTLTSAYGFVGEGGVRQEKGLAPGTVVPYDMRARMHDPLLGRSTSRDPVWDLNLDTVHGCRGTPSFAILPAADLSRCSWISEALAMSEKEKTCSELLADIQRAIPLLFRRSSPIGFHWNEITAARTRSVVKTPSLNEDFFEAAAELLRNEFGAAAEIWGPDLGSTGNAGENSAYVRTEGVVYALLTCGWYPVGTARARTTLDTEGSDGEWSLKLASSDAQTRVQRTIERLAAPWSQLLYSHGYSYIPWDFPGLHEGRVPWDYLFYLGVPSG